jgi:hypothetical protein
MQEVHRSGPLKQRNKSHKQAFRSNRQLKNVAGGRVTSLSGKGKSSSQAESRAARRQRSQMQRKSKREQALNRKRSIGQPHNAPIVVTVLYIGDDYSEQKARSVLDLLLQSEEDAIVRQCELGKLSFEHVPDYL